MKKILVDINSNDFDVCGEYDIFHKTDYKKLDHYVKEIRKGDCPNFGNRLWFQAIISEIQSDDNELYYFDEEFSKEYINKNFDMVLAPMANVFSLGYTDLLNSLADKFEGIKIPIYVIACGIQANSYDSLNEIVKDLEKPAKRFISAVYNSGGEFALRGYFTKEFFEKLGFSSAVVTGCPSLYQSGRNLQIDKKPVAREDFKFAINGDLGYYSNLLNEYPNATFFDQHAYYSFLYDEDFMQGMNKDAFIKHMIKIYGTGVTKALCNNQVMLIPNMNDWRQYLITQNYNFSYGSRIHGTIMPLLAGVPAVLDARDARTREMAEFYDIPVANTDSGKSLYEIFESADFTKFNEKFKIRFDAFEEFLRKCGICDKVNENNQFFYDEAPNIVTPNQQTWENVKGQYYSKKRSYDMYETLLKIKRKLI